MPGVEVGFCHHFVSRIFEFVDNRSQTVAEEMFDGRADKNHVSSGIPCLASRSALKNDTCSGTDILMIRELTGGIYFGARQEHSGSFDSAFDTDIYQREEIERMTRMAGALAMKHDPPLSITSVDKANVLAACGRLWRGVVTETLRTEFPAVKFRHLLVDSAAAELVQNPKGLNGILLTSNMFGDILSDQASGIVGSMGLLPSASLSETPGDSSSRVRGLYEPVHGSAPNLCGTNTVNPIGTILSVAMMCRYSLGLNNAAIAIETAVHDVLESGIKTPDLGGSSTTAALGDAVLAHLKIL